MTHLLDALAAHHTWLFAAARDRGGRTDFVVVSVVALVVVALSAWRGWILWKRYTGQQTHCNPRKLFTALCRAHKLDSAQQRLLTLVANSQQLRQPAALFLQPELWQPEKLGPQFASQLPQLQSIQRRLFGGG